MRLILIGPPGAGKGVLSERLSDHYGIPPISTGDMFRAAIRDKSGLGEQVEKFLAAGELVPDDVVEKVVRERLAQEDAKGGFLLDGFPRTVHQAAMLDALLQEQGLELDAIVELQLEESVILKRLTSRRVCPQCDAVYNVITMKPRRENHCDFCGQELVQRKDDTEEVIRGRLEVFRTQTEPVLSYYRDKGKVVAVESGQEAKATFAAVLEALK